MTVTILPYLVVVKSTAAEIPGLAYQGDQASVKDENGIEWPWSGASYVLPSFASSGSGSGSGGGGGGGTTPTVPPTYANAAAVQPGIVFQSHYVVGTAMVGDVGVAVNSPASYIYQWFRNGSAISGATSLSYMPVSADGGQTLQFGVTPSNAAGSDTQMTLTAGVFVNAS